MELNKKLAKKIWGDLGDIPVDENDCLDCDFFIKETNTMFEKGTDKFDVWHWFEETFDLSVAKDLMYLN